MVIHYNTVLVNNQSYPFTFPYLNLYKNSDLFHPNNDKLNYTLIIL